MTPPISILQITDWDLSTSMLNSQYGRVTFAWWCQLEASRINRSGGDVEVVNEGLYTCIKRKSL